MGLNPNHTRVIRKTAADEEERFKTIAHLQGKRASITVEQVE